MATPLDLSVVVPAFNEAARIGPTLGEILQYGRERNWRFEVVVVDDGSTDETAAATQGPAGPHSEIRLIRHEVNRGKGHAVRSGVLTTTANRILVVDADGATPISEYERLSRALDTGATIAIGSRALASTDTVVDARWYRRAMGRTFHAAVTALTGTEVADTQCGFKLFKGDTGRRLFAESRVDRFAYDVEILLLARQKGIRVVEVPVNWRHVPGSRINLVTDSLHTLMDVWRIRRIHQAG